MRRATVRARRWGVAMGAAGWWGGADDRPLSDLWSRPRGPCCSGGHGAGGPAPGPESPQRLSPHRDYPALVAQLGATGAREKGGLAPAQVAPAPHDWEYHWVLRVWNGSYLNHLP